MAHRVIKKLKPLQSNTPSGAQHQRKCIREATALLPGLVGLHVPNIAKLPATFVLTIMKIKDNVVVKGRWKDLLYRHYFYGLLDVSLIGFKIVKNDFDKHGWVVLDFNLDKVIYREYPKMLSYPSNIESGEKDYVDVDSEDSSSSLTEKKKKKAKEELGFKQ